MDDIEYKAYLIMLLFQSIDEKIDTQVLSYEEYYNKIRIESSLDKCYNT